MKKKRSQSITRMISSMENKVSASGEIFVEIAKLLQEGKGMEAMALIEKHRETLFKEDPEKTLRANFELRFLLGQFDEAYEDYAYYAALPYVSQEIEEILRELPKLIRANELSSVKGKAFDEEQAHAALNDGDDPYAVLGVLQQLKTQDITPFLEEIESLLLTSIHDDVKTFALLLLVEKNVDKKIKFIKNNKTYELNPSSLGNPFAEPIYVDIRKYAGTLKDSSLSSVCIQLLDQLALSSYPERLCGEERKDVFKNALLALGKSYLGEEVSLGEKEKSELKKMKARLAVPSLLG